MVFFITKLIYGMWLQERLLVEEAGGIVNDLNQYPINKIDIKASSASINDQMLKSLKNF